MGIPRLRGGSSEHESPRDCTAGTGDGAGRSTPLVDATMTPPKDGPFAPHTKAIAPRLQVGPGQRLVPPPPMPLARLLPREMPQPAKPVAKPAAAAAAAAQSQPPEPETAPARALPVLIGR